jgi:hypothetical protein
MSQRGIPHHDRLGNHPLGGYMRKSIIVGTSVLTLLSASSIILADQDASAAATNGNAQGVTASTIRVGISVVDFAAIAKLGGALMNQGNEQNAYNALIADVNKHGGVDGRKVVPFYATVSPIGTAIRQRTRPPSSIPCSLGRPRLVRRRHSPSVRRRMLLTR